jgi:uncharacterized protein
MSIDVSLNMYSASVPVLGRMLSNLLVWLDKAEQHAHTKKFDPQVFLGLRLAPDMLAFTKQIQIACDIAKFGVARLSSTPAPSFQDTETSLGELRQRIINTLAFVQSITPEKLHGSDNADITVPRRDDPLRMKGEPYLKFFVLPNVYFHLTIAYALLRQAGVELGKSDFLGEM